MTKKIIIHILGLFFLAFGIVTTVSAKVGSAPLDAVNTFVSQLTNGKLSLDVTTLITNALMALIVLLFTKKPKILISLLVSLILSGFIKFWLSIYGYVPDDLMTNLVFRFGIDIVAILVITVSTGVLIFNDLILSPYDEFILFISKKTNSYQKGRSLVDFTYFILAIILGLILNSVTNNVSIFDTSNVLYEQINVMTIILVLLLPILIDKFSKFIKRRVNLNETK